MQIMSCLAGILVFLTFFMKTMIPLRVIAILSNIAFITYALLGLTHGIFDKVIAIFIMHISMLPLNIVRLVQMRSLVKQVHEASSNTDMHFLIPYMKSEKFQKDQELFKVGDIADKLYFIQEGSVHIPELNETFEQGKIFGEVGLFVPDNVRVVSALVVENSSILSIQRSKVMELYYQNPKFGFYLMGLVSEIVQKTSQNKTLSGPRLTP